MGYWDTETVDGEYVANRSKNEYMDMLPSIVTMGIKGGYTRKA